MGVFEAELALERLEAQLAADLPAHVRAFAAAYAAGQPAPPAPEVAGQPSSAGIARTMLAELRKHPPPAALDREATGLDADKSGLHVAARTHALLRLLVPIAVESDPQVVAVRAVASSSPPTWEDWQRLAVARDAVSRARFGLPHVTLMHALNGRAAPIVAGFHFTERRDGEGWPAPVDGWHDPMPPISGAFVERAWRDLATIHGARGTCRIVRAAARPRAFVIEPGREVTVVIGTIDSAAARFAALHELGHAIAALLVPFPLARIVDEAVAAYIARLVEQEAALDLDWYTPVATAARTRRRAIAAALDAIERGSAERPIERPPWALWNDPAAQAAYVVAETIAERWWTELGGSPPAGALAAAITTEQAAIDRVGLPL